MATVPEKKRVTKPTAPKPVTSKPAAPKPAASKPAASASKSTASASKSTAPASKATVSRPAASKPAAPKPAAPSASAPWEGHAKWFGGEEKYAEAIKEKESKGIPLSDPAAAAAFKAAHPEYFRSAPTTAKEEGDVGSEPQTQQTTTKEESNVDSELWMSNMMRAIEERLKELEQLSWPPQIPQVAPRERPAPAVPEVGTAPEVTGVPAVVPPTPQPERLPEGVRRGVGGFERAVVPKMTLPNEEELYRIYREVFGPETEERYVRQFLVSPWFRRVLGGSVPMYMATNPLWREYLRRLGLREAVGRRLTGAG